MSRSSIPSAGDDFAGTPRTVFFLPQDDTQTAIIGIIDDDVIENPELFLLELSSSDPAVHIPMPNATVLILDNDGNYIILLIIVN